MEERSETPAWAFCLLVYLACATLAAWRTRDLPPEALRRLEALENERDPARMNRRELRALPGIGDGRANEIVEERWRGAGAESLELPSEGDPLESGGEDVRDWGLEAGVLDVPRGEELGGQEEER